MQEELGHLKDHETGLSGRLVLGGIPSALPMIPLLTKKIRIIHPGIDFTVLSQSSEEILRGIADFSVDVGITYLDNEPIEGLLATPLYIERYCLFVPETHALAKRDVGHLARGFARAAVPADTQYAEPAHYRPRVRNGELSSTSRGSKQIPSSICARM